MLALVETLRARVRNGHDTYVLFLDLQKAYDSVHRRALDHLLKTMGMPARFVDFIIRWFNQRRSSVLVNGQRAAPFPVAKGLPQGEILAPDLFNLFITPLQYYLDELQGYNGVEWPAREAAGARRLVIRDLWYADDMAAMAVSVGELQLVLDAVALWSAHWGINIGFGDGKTAVMYVPASIESLQDASRKPDVFAGGVKVAWVDEYRYLGMRLRADLTDAGTLGMLHGRLVSTGSRFIVYNKAVRSLSVTAQRQLVQMMVLGCVSYLMAVLPLADSDISQALDPPINRVLRSVFGARMLMPLSNLLADSGVLPAVALVAQHRVRLHQTLRLLVGGQTPAALVARELERDRAANGRVGAGRTRSWAATVHETCKAFMHVTGAQEVPTAGDLAHVHHASARLGRMYGYHLARYNHLERGGCGAVDRPFGVPLPPENPLFLSAGLHCFGYFDRVASRRAERGTRILGASVAKTPASVWGSGYLGSPLGLSRRLSSRHSAVIARARMGVDAMVSWPFAASAQEQRAAEAEAAGADAGADPAAAGAAGGPPLTMQQQAAHARSAARTQCVLCSTDAVPSPPCDVWHLLCECTHPHIVEHQAAVYRSAGQMLSKLCKQLVEAAMRAEPPDDDDEGGGGGGGGQQGADVQQGAAAADPAAPPPPPPPAVPPPPPPPAVAAAQPAPVDALAPASVFAFLAALAAEAVAAAAGASQPGAAGGAAAGAAGAAGAPSSAAGAGLPASAAPPVVPAPGGDAALGDGDNPAAAAAGAAAAGPDAGASPATVARNCSTVIRSMVREGIDWTTADSHHVLYRLVLAVPFSEADVRTVGPTGTGTRQVGAPTALANATAQFPLAHWFGRLLDHVVTTTGQRRQAADTWAWWSYETLMGLASRRACAMGAPFRNRPCDCVAAAASAQGGAVAAAAPPAAAAEAAPPDPGDDFSDLDSLSESE